MKLVELNEAVHIIARKKGDKDWWPLAKEDFEVMGPLALFHSGRLNLAQHFYSEDQAKKWSEDWSKKHPDYEVKVIKE